MATGVRVAITLACTECKRRNYQSQKSKRNTPDRFEASKYCRWCGRHPGHRETRSLARPSRTRRKRSDFQAPAQPERARTRQRQVKPTGQPKSQTGQKRERRGGFRAFVGECWAELRKVDWPGRQQLISATIVVIIAVAITGAYLFVTDWAVQRFVRDVLLNL